jgi:hypothetical protein
VSLSRHFPFDPFVPDVLDLTGHCTEAGQPIQRFSHDPRTFLAFFGRISSGLDQAALYQELLLAVSERTVAALPLCLVCMVAPASAQPC